MRDQHLSYTYLETPIGRLLLAGTGEELHFIGFPSGKGAFGPEPGWVRSDESFGEAKAQLLAYFAGELQQFTFPTKLTGTAFQVQVWRALAGIPYGETTSYGALAEKLGRPGASRAVGAANGANPIPIVFPCHRVIGSNGLLTGFGGGIELKKTLLEHEKAVSGKGDCQPSLFRQAERQSSL